MLVLVALTWAAAPARAEPAEVVHRVMHIEQVDFSEGAGGATQRVQLPDTWAQRGLATTGHGRYHGEFRLDRVDPVMWALRIDRLSTRHRVLVNGALVSGGKVGGADAPSAMAQLARPLPAWIELPPRLLVPGVNTLDIAVDHGVRGGLSSIWIGPADALVDDYGSAEYLAVRLPRQLNAAGLALATMLLLLWWRRRSERLLGGMAALLALACLRNLTYFAGDTRAFNHAWGDWLYHLVQVVTAIAVCHFALLMARRDRAGVVQALWLACAVLVGLGGLASAHGWMQTLRTWTYPVLLMLVLPALGLAIGAIRRDASQPRAALIIALLALTVGAGHDYLCWRGITSVMDVYWVPFAVPLALLVTSSHMIQRLVVALRDVEALNTGLELRVAARTRDLEAANQAKSRFIAAASHDLRQPALAIGLLVGVMREQAHGPSLRAMIDRVDDAVASMEDLLAGLLDLSRLEAEVVRPRVTDFALQPLFDAIAAHESVSAARKGLSLRLRPTRLSVRSDRVLLEQIMRNLVSNALRFTERGGVLVAARRSGGEVRLQVWDSGRGVPYDSQTLIFEEFVQVEPQGAGLGLGLSIVKRTANLLGHALALRSIPGRGSCFCVQLPQAGAVPGIDTVADPAPPALAGRRILVIDDDASVRRALVDRLEQWGADVIACDSLHALRDWIERHATPDAGGPGGAPASGPASAQPRGGASLAAGRVAGPTSLDLLISDQRLPDGNGLAALVLLRRHHLRLPGLLITGNTSVADLAELADSGVPVLHKPFRASALLQAIDAVFDGAAPAPQPPQR